MNDLSYSLAQEELIKLFSKSCNKKIFSILQIQQY